MLSLLRSGTCVALAVAFGLFASLRAQVEASALPEAAALSAKGRADYATARAALAGMLADFCSGAGAVGADLSAAERAARAEYCALMLARLFGEGGDNVTLAALAAARASTLAAERPALRASLGSMRLGLLRVSGGDVDELVRELGVIRSLWICGPFDNERGAGYSAKNEALRTFDPDARFAGKLREVSWRLLPEQPRAGHFPLGQVLRPSEQVMAYVATTVIATEAVDAALVLGTTGAYRVFLNGEEVHAHDVQRRLYDGQDAAVLPLQAGPNLLVVKACHEEGGDFGIRLRLQQLDGGPLPQVRCSDAVADMVAAGKMTPRKAADDARFDNNARAYLSAQIAAATDDESDAAAAAAALRLASLRAHLHIEGDRDRKAIRLCDRAIAGLPECAEACFVRFWTRPRMTRTAADSDTTQLRQDLAGALARDAKHVEARLLLASIELTSSRLPVRAERVLREALAQQPRSSIALGTLAPALAAQGLDGPAGRVYHTIAKLPVISVFIGRQVFRWFDSLGEYRAAARLAEQQSRYFQELPDMQAYASLQMRTQGAERGAELLQLAIARWPLHRSPRAMLAGLYTGEGRLQEALQTWSAWLELCPDDDDALLAIAELHGRNGDRERQIEMLQGALAINPNLAAEQRYLDWLQKDQTPFYAAFELDGEEILAADAGAPADADENQDALHHVLQQRVVKAYANGTTSEYVHMIVRVLREEGARRMANWAPPHSYGEQRARILACVVRHADGTTERPRLRGAYVSLPSLRIGDVVDVRARVDDTAPTFFGDYFGLEHYFFAPDGMPVARSQLTVVTTPGRDYRWQVANGAPDPEVLEMADGEMRYDWEMRDIGRDDPEVARPMAKEWLPLARMTTYRDWDQFAGWWWNLIEKQVDVSAAMRAKVRELCAQATTPRERLDAIYRFVTTDVRYEAWEFGVHGYKPYNTSVIFERRHGDCKDKALLMCAMLSEVGIVARPVLIYADPRRTEDDLAVPLVNHFNHCIAWLPEQEGLAERFVDGTADLHPTELLPEMDQGASVLVVEPDGAGLKDVPVIAAAANARDVVYAFALDADGAGRGRITMLPTGNDAVPMRRLLVGPPRDMSDVFERELQQRFGPATVTTVERSDGKDLQKPVRVVEDFVIEGMARVAGDGLEFDPGFQTRALQQLTTAAERALPLLLGVPKRDHEILRISVPAGMQPTRLPPPVRIQKAFASFVLEWRREGDRVVIERDLRLTATRIAPADYAAFREFVADVRDADSTRLLFSRNPQKNSQSPNDKGGR
ncbi:MAG: DUF3857 domain-containing protein [Planctomycetota bacterium]